MYIYNDLTYLHETREQIAMGKVTRQRSLKASGGYTQRRSNGPQAQSNCHVDVSIDNPRGLDDKTYHHVHPV